MNDTDYNDYMIDWRQRVADGALHEDFDFESIYGLTVHDVATMLLYLA